MAAGRLMVVLDVASSTDDWRRMLCMKPWQLSAAFCTFDGARGGGGGGGGRLAGGDAKALEAETDRLCMRAGRAAGAANSPQ